jgi:hypothetical protein
VEKHEVALGGSCFERRQCHGADGRAGGRVWVRLALAHAEIAVASLPAFISLPAVVVEGSDSVPFAPTMQDEEVAEHKRCRIPISLRTLTTLGDGKWLNDEVINCSMSLMQVTDPLSWLAVQCMARLQSPALFVLAKQVQAGYVSCTNLNQVCCCVDLASSASSCILLNSKNGSIHALCRTGTRHCGKPTVNAH